MESLYKQYALAEATFHKVVINFDPTHQGTYRYWKSHKMIKVSANVDIHTFIEVLFGMARYVIKKQKKLYITTYKQMMWIVDRMNKYNVPITPEVEFRMKKRVFYDLTTYNNKRGDMYKLDPNVRTYLSDVEPNFNTWVGKYVSFSIVNNTIQSIKTPRTSIQKASESQRRIIEKRIRISKIFNEDV
jgi:hypothetical protein